MQTWRGPAATFDRLRSTYWFLPSIVTLAAIGLGVLLTTVEQGAVTAPAWMGWVYGGGADGARAVLSAIAGSTITVVSVTFSVMVVALTVSSQHFGPRLLNSFMRDNAAQLVLGTFTGTFAYCLVVLRTVQGDGAGSTAFVPHIAVTVGLAAALLSVGVLIYYVHHIASALQVSEITAGVALEFERAIDRLYPERVGSEARHDMVPATPEEPTRAAVVRSVASGYVQGIDGVRVLALAVQYDATIWLTARPGDFVVEGSPIASVHPRPAQMDDLASHLRALFLLGNDRTSFQDAGFAAQQLVEVALRALSPGVNEPYTAVTCIDRLGQGLARLADRAIPSPARADDRGRVRVVAEPLTFGDLLRAALEPIALSSDNNPVIGRRLLETLRMLAGVARRPDDADAIQDVASLVLASANRGLQHEGYRAELTQLRTDVGNELSAVRPTDQASGHEPRTAV